MSGLGDPIVTSARARRPPVRKHARTLNRQALHRHWVEGGPLSAGEQLGASDKHRVDYVPVHRRGAPGRALAAGARGPPGQALLPSSVTGARWATRTSDRRVRLGSEAPVPMPEVSASQARGDVAQYRTEDVGAVVGTELIGDGQQQSVGGGDRLILAQLLDELLGFPGVGLPPALLRDARGLADRQSKGCCTETRRTELWRT
jgi:hypothetical protein